MLAVDCVGGTAVDVAQNIEPLRHRSSLSEDLSRVVGLPAPRRPRHVDGINTFRCIRRSLHVVGVVWRSHVLRLHRYFVIKCDRCLGFAASSEIGQPDATWFPQKSIYLAAHVLPSSSGLTPASDGVRASRAIATPVGTPPDRRMTLSLAQRAVRGLLVSRFRISAAGPKARRRSGAQPEQQGVSRRPVRIWRVAPPAQGRGTRDDGR